jgi:hypothetical protein
MSRILNRRNLLLILSAIVILPVTWWISAGLRGQLMARYDVAHGRFKLLVYGLPASGFPEYRRLLRERYGVEVVSLGCVATDGSYTNAYDRVVTAVVNRRFGRDVFKESSDEATKRSQEKHKAELQNVSRSE